MAVDESEDRSAIDQLPEVYASALRLRDAGLTQLEIGHRLKVEQEAVDTLLRLAEAKLAAVRATH